MFAGKDGRVILAHLPRCERFAVCVYSGAARALHLRQTDAMQYPGNNKGELWVLTSYSLSDDRIKFNEQKLEYGLAQVVALEPKRYDRAEYEYDPETEEFVVHPEKTANEIGLIAQEVQKVIPEAVSIPEDENRELWAISYETIVTVLVKAVQEQQAQIEELRQEIQAMKSGI